VRIILEPESKNPQATQPCRRAPKLVGTASARASQTAAMHAYLGHGPYHDIPDFGPAPNTRYQTRAQLHRKAWTTRCKASRQAARPVASAGGASSARRPATAAATRNRGGSSATGGGGWRRPASAPATARQAPRQIGRVQHRAGRMECTAQPPQYGVQLELEPAAMRASGPGAAHHHGLTAHAPRVPRTCGWANSTRAKRGGTGFVGCVVERAPVPDPGAPEPPRRWATGAPRPGRPALPTPSPTPSPTPTPQVRRAPRWRSLQCARPPERDTFAARD
jgi:hypothetical protein